MTNSAWEVSLSLIIPPRATPAQGCHKVTFHLNPLRPAVDCQRFLYSRAVICWFSFI